MGFDGLPITRPSSSLIDMSPPEYLLLCPPPGPPLPTFSFFSLIIISGGREVRLFVMTPAEADVVNCRGSTAEGGRWDSLEEEELELEVKGKLVVRRGGCKETDLLLPEEEEA